MQPRPAGMQILPAGREENDELSQKSLLGPRPAESLMKRPYLQCQRLMNGRLITDEIAFRLRKSQPRISLGQEYCRCNPTAHSGETQFSIMGAFSTRRSYCSRAASFCKLALWLPPA